MNTVISSDFHSIRGIPSSHTSLLFELIFAFIALPIALYSQFSQSYFCLGLFVTDFLTLDPI